jgi:hypothetical protein
MTAQSQLAGYEYARSNPKFIEGLSKAFGEEITADSHVLEYIGLLFCCTCFPRASVARRGLGTRQRNTRERIWQAVRAQHIRHHTRTHEDLLLGKEHLHRLPPHVGLRITRGNALESTRSGRSTDGRRGYSQIFGHSSTMTTFNSYGPVTAHRQAEILNALVDAKRLLPRV